MRVRDIMMLAKKGRPDLAAINLGCSGAGIWRHPVRLLRVIQRYPHSSGAKFDLRYLVVAYREGRKMRED